jgi:DNA-binding transcriptional ArsR family regulator
MTHYLTADSRMQPYLMFPRFLMELEIPDTAKLLYILLLDRARVSQRTPGWADEHGRIFVLYPINELASALHRGESAVKAALSALEDAKLISRQRQGIGKPSRIYVRLPDDGKPTMRQSENRLTDRRNSGSQTGGNPSTNKNKRIITTDTNYRDYDCGEDESL